jgi:hypothetical protein
MRKNFKLELQLIEAIPAEEDSVEVKFPPHWGTRQAEDFVAIIKDILANKEVSIENVHKGVSKVV